MAKNDQPLLASITQNPLLISQASQQLFQDSIQHVVMSEHAEAMLNEASSIQASDEDFWPSSPDDWRSAYRPYNVKDGVLQIPVMGVLLNRFGYQFGRWATGYTYIEKALKRGLADGNVKAIAFVIDSPGGEVAGCFELVDKIYEARGEKPFRAFAADHAYSAAYAIYSAANDGAVTRSGGVGSIGVVTAHVEYSEMFKDIGMKITFIFAGEHKVDGNAYEKLPESVKSRIQDRIDRIYGVFTSTVARNRGMDEEAVRDTKALTFDANDSIDAGLADRIGALDEEMAIFSAEVAAAEDEQMANDNKTNDPKMVEQATHEAAVASATAAGEAAGSAAATTRIKAIIGCDAGKVRPKAALSFALNTTMSLEEATAVLTDLPEEKVESSTPAPKAAVEEETGKPKASAKKTPFEESMDASGNPTVGADGDDDDDVDDDAKASQSILSAYAGATGKVKKPKAA